MAVYQISHATEYGYDAEVSSSYGEAHLLPRELSTQHCRAASLAIDPAPSDLRHRTDFFGNHASFFAVLDPHTQLSVTASSVVAVHARPAPGPDRTPWEQARPLERTDAGALEAAPFALDSPLVAAAPELRAIAEPIFTPGRPILDALAGLSAYLHDEFAYRPGATSVHSTLAEVLAARAGVCQDFAHLMIGCLRSLRLAARYVSGYLETEPPPGQERLQGADASHAWVSVWVPDAGWVDLDPTNDQFVGERHITVGWGRDYQDVPPLKGVIFTAGARHELTVRVDVLRLTEAGNN